MSDTGLAALDLFSGPGGLALGMKAASIHPVAAIEHNRDAVATYAQHSPEADLLSTDIREVDFSEFGGVDLVFGGPPCQPFSSGGLRRAALDPRDMVPEFLRALREIRPQAFLMENVYGLASRAHRPYLQEILREMARLGYDVSWQVLLAADYGVPQKRRRLFVVGTVREGFRFPDPTHGPGRSNPYVSAGEVITHEPVGEPAQSAVWYAQKVDLRRSPYAGQIFNGGGRPIDLSVPCSTILASAGGNKTPWVDTQDIVPAYHAHLMAGGRPRQGIVPGARRLSVEESALIQTFPEDLKFQGSKSSRFRQVGDAVPPLLAKSMGLRLARHLGKMSSEEGQNAKPSARSQETLWSFSEAAG